MLDEWESIAPPKEAGTRNVLLADSRHPLDFRIGRTSCGHYVFLLDAERPSLGIPSLPKVKGMTIELEEPKKSRVRLVLDLEDRSDLQNFALVCSSLMLATQSFGASMSSEGFLRTLVELHRWHELLKRRGEKRLTRSERIGLFGELLFLREELVPRMGITVALQAWTGKDKHEQDFVIDSTIFEVKTQIVTADRMINISSEDQLDAVQGRILICNQGIAPALEKSPESRTLNSIAKELADLTNAHGGLASDLLAIGLLEAGFEPHPEYGEEAWALVDRKLFHVCDDFPRIERGELRLGVEQVRYKIRVSDCQQFEVDLKTAFGELLDE